MHNIIHNDRWAKTKETSFITATIVTPAHREWQTPCLHYVLQLVDDVTCCCCHVEGLHFVHICLCVCTFIYCWEMLIVATASLCVGTGAVPVLHHGLKTAAGNEEKTGRGRNGREGKRGKHFRKEWHGTQTRQSLKPADNPADWFGHIRAGTKPPSGRAGHVSAGWNADWQLF